MSTQRAKTGWLLLGDIVTILIVTVIGFLDHYGDLQGWRWLSTFLPVLVAWLVIAPWFGVYQADVTNQVRQIWRPALAVFLSAPFAATLRGLWLNVAILPIFVIVLGLTNALGLLIWRFLWTWITQRAARRVGGQVDQHG